MKKYYITDAQIEREWDGKEWVLDASGAAYSESLLEAQRELENAKQGWFKRWTETPKSEIQIVADYPDSDQIEVVESHPVKRSFLHIKPSPAEKGAWIQAARESEFRKLEAWVINALNERVANDTKNENK